MTTFEYSRFSAFRSLYSFIQSRSYQPLRTTGMPMAGPCIPIEIVICLFIFFSIEMKH